VPFLVNRLCGKDVQALSKMGHQKRQTDARSTPAAKGLSLCEPKTRKFSVQC
jgi:hypothetical protein